MSESIPYTRAVPFSRPAGRRRIEVFSPKIGRHLSLGGYDAYRTWLVIEANPHIVTFCERPTYVDGPRGPVIDFWVQLRGAPSGEFWMEERLTCSAGPYPFPTGRALLPIWSATDATAMPCLSNRSVVFLNQDVLAQQRTQA